MVCFIPEKGIYVGANQALCICSEISALLESGKIDGECSPFLCELKRSIDLSLMY